MVYYLKCKYFADSPMFLKPHEYVVTFKSALHRNPRPVIKGKQWPPEGEEWCIVLREDVDEKDHIEGLVRVLIDSRNNESACVRIFNAPDNKHDVYLVPSTEIIQQDNPN